MPYRTRIAPSPTGDFHVGSLAIALKNYAWSKRSGGQFVVRIEDTDQERLVEGTQDKLLEILTKFGLNWDEGPGVGGPYEPYVQSQRLDLYQKHAQSLVEHGMAYPCFCSRERLEEMRQQQRANKQPPKYDRQCLNLSPAEVQQRIEAGQAHVIRLKVPENQELTFKDALRGKITFSSQEVDDQVLVKSDGFPTYHLAVVIDDSLMKINYVMRGEEWISSTPKHVLLYESFKKLATENNLEEYSDWNTPTYAHIPVFLNPDGRGKMSKRKGTVSAQSFLDQGYLPAALLNFLMILGWTPRDQREILTLDEYVQEFDPQDVSHNSVQFDIKKLDWINGQYIRQLPANELAEQLEPFLPEDFPQERLSEILPLVQERLSKLSDLEELTEFFYRDTQPDKDFLLKKADQALVSDQLRQTISSLEPIGDDWSLESIETALRNLQNETGWKKSQYFMMIRVAVTGKTKTPPLFETIQVLGRQRTLDKLNQALSLVQV